MDEETLVARERGRRRTSLPVAQAVAAVVGGRGFLGGEEASGKRGGLGLLSHFGGVREMNLERGWKTKES